MPGFNRVTLIGNLTRDPQIKQLPSNTSVADFGLAINRHYRTAGGEDREEVCFIDCAAFGRQAEVIGQYCKKGKPLFVEGRLKYDTWDDRNGGGKRSKVSVVVENFQFLGGRGEDGSQPGHGQQQTMFGEQQKSAPQKPSAKQEQHAGEKFTESDIPF